MSGRQKFGKEGQATLLALIVKGARTVNVHAPLAQAQGGIALEALAIEALTDEVEQGAVFIRKEKDSHG